MSPLLVASWQQCTVEHPRHTHPNNPLRRHKDTETIEDNTKIFTLIGTVTWIEIHVPSWGHRNGSKAGQAVGEPLTQGDRVRRIRRLELITVDMDAILCSVRSWLVTEHYCYVSVMSLCGFTQLQSSPRSDINHFRPWQLPQTKLDTIYWVKYWTSIQLQSAVSPSSAVPIPLRNTSWTNITHSHSCG